MHQHLVGGCNYRVLLRTLKAELLIPKENKGGNYAIFISYIGTAVVGETPVIATDNAQATLTNNCTATNYGGISVCGNALTYLNIVGNTFYGNFNHSAIYITDAIKTYTYKLDDESIINNLFDSSGVGARHINLEGIDFSGIGVSLLSTPKSYSGSATWYYLAASAADLGAWQSATSSGTKSTVCAGTTS